MIKAQASTLAKAVRSEAGAVFMTPPPSKPPPLEMEVVTTAGRMLVVGEMGVVGVAPPPLTGKPAFAHLVSNVWSKSSHPPVGSNWTRHGAHVATEL